MLIAARNGFLVGKRLPYDAEVEYLESTGTQWIDTGVIVDSNNFVMTALFSKSSSEVLQVAFGAMNALLGYPGIMINMNGGFRYGNQQIASSTGTSTNTMHTYVLSYRSLTIDGTTYAATGDVVDTPLEYSLYLFGRNNMGSLGNASSVKFASFVVQESNILVRDFIPVRRGNVGYLYDRVSKRLFGNQGTGDFTLGPDKAAGVSALNGGGHKRKCVRRSYRRFWRHSVRFSHTPLWKEVA